MQIAPSPNLPTSLEEAAYKAFQWSKNYFGVAHKFASTQASSAIVKLWQLSDQVLGQQQPRQLPGGVPISATTMAVVQARYERLLDADWQDAVAGYYPKSLLFDNPWADFVQYYPLVWADLISISDRVTHKRFQDFAADVDTEGYPDYYIQNFHHQTNGYLSDLSASLYDLQVELLFGGSADAMRRRIVRPLVDYAARWGKSQRILDVACGTGRTLRLLRQSLPDVQLVGTDLSPAYLRKANQLLSELPGELPQLIQAPGEALPFTDNYFDALTTVFLFHELPRAVRQPVIAEMVRVTKPGGVIVICDSIQIEDSPELQESMEAFAQIFHEPYYRDYIRDDLGAYLTAAGCEILEVTSHFMSRYTVARKSS
ncbi:MAG: class I SAM-dependent methyltransferase [Synechococcaceae cyanobacterium SM2_3_60]|nr:class I SAM-dependent methyltransferase [Synechococcaceae cyanobacterium SM2_3_60]